MKFKFGVENLLGDSQNIELLKGKKVALMAHPGSVDSELNHSLDLLARHPDINLTCGFGPQHGIMGDLQDNMMESEDIQHPEYGIPIFSLYGEVRRPTPQMMDCFDVVLIDLQDVGTRIYTYLTTLFYLMEDCQRDGKELWVLDRPNPAGRHVEGSLLKDGFTSFVGHTAMPICHGLTLGEAAKWYLEHAGLSLKFRLIAMTDYAIEENAWPKSNVWINPSPNIASYYTSRIFPGTVLLEGTTLSEGRGTTVPLEVIGAPDIDFDKVAAWLSERRPDWLSGCKIRSCFFRPTFQKHSESTCKGLQIHCCDAVFDAKEMKPYRLIAGLLKGVRALYPDYPIWRDFHYEYEKDRLAIDLINGGPGLRQFVDDQQASFKSFDDELKKDEMSWREQIRPFLIY